MRFNAMTLAGATGGRVVREAPPGALCTDTRQLAPGDWFVALVGPRFDGHDFLETALAAGAAGCLVQREVGTQGGLVVVEDTTKALQDLGRHARSQLIGPVVALTGSSGKTTTRALCSLALSPLGRVHQTVGNLNNHLGVPLTLVAAPEDAAATVVECGTSSPGEIGFLAELCTPDVRLLINVGPAHLQELGGLDGVALEKGAIVRTARPGDVVVLNEDDPRVTNQPVPEGVRRVGYGHGENCEIRLLEATLDPRTFGMACRWRTPKGEVEGTVPAPGFHVAHDATAALAVAFALGVEPRQAVAQFVDYAPVGMRLRREPLPHEAVALNDAYNANPASMRASLELLAQLPGRRVAVLGDMLELGTEEAALHHEVVQAADALGLDLLLCLGPRMALAAPAAKRTPTWSAEDGLSLVDRLLEWLRPGDHALFKGSRGARVERFLQELQARGGGS